MRKKWARKEVNRSGAWGLSCNVSEFFNSTMNPVIECFIRFTWISHVFAKIKNQSELNFVSAHWQSAAYFYSQFSKQKIIIMIMISLLWWSIKLWNVPEIQSKLSEAVIKHAVACILTDNCRNFLWNLPKRRKITGSNLKAFFADQFLFI